VLHRVAQLGRLGVEATIRHFADPRLASDVDTHDALFLYRVPETAHTASVIERARSRDARVAGAIDDLIFVPDESLFPDLARSPASERELWLDGVRRYRATLERCDLFVAPTEPILDAARRLGWRAVLHRNSISPPELELGAR